MNQKLKQKVKNIIITIDGTAASGKGTAAHLLSRDFGLLNLDSGACYRAVAWLGLEYGVPIDEAHVPELLKLLEEYPLRLKPNPEPTGPKCFVKVGRRDITHLIRTPKIGDAASIIGEFPEIRIVIRDLVRKIASDHPSGVIAEGRDSGTVVFPEADIKFFLTAAPEVRARRRYEEYVVAGGEVTYDQVLQEIVERDERDTSRAYSALRIPVDAYVVDSTEYTIEQTHEVMREYIVERLGRSRE